MTHVPDHVMAGLRSLLGPGRVFDDPDTLARRSLDTWPLPLVQQVVGREPPAPSCVVRPGSTEEVSEALAYLTGNGIPVVPYGGGSGVQGGAAPPPGAAVIDLGAMDQVLSLDEDNLTVTVQAGVLLGVLERWLGKRGYTGGHYPQSIDLAEVGGLVATRSAGQFSTRYGSIEDLVAGLEAVLPDGRVVRVGSQPRRAVGPDLRQLWLGSEGAFGVITEVTLKVFLRPPDRWLQAYGVGSMRAGLDVIHGSMRDGWKPRSCASTTPSRPRAASAGRSRRECFLLLLSEGPAGYAQAEGAASTRGPGPPGCARWSRTVETWLDVRNDVRELEMYLRQGIIVDTIEVAAPWTAIADIYEQVLHRLGAEVPEMLVVSAHSSHSYAQGTNLYFVLGAQPPRDADEMARVYEAIGRG